MVTVAIVDDHPALREGTAALIDREPDLHVTSLAGSLQEAATLLAGPVMPDVLVLDIRLGEERGLDLLADLAAADPAVSRPAVIIWTAYDLPQYASFAMRAGAAGFVLKTAPTRELLEAIRGAARGVCHFAVVEPGEEVRLSDRERDVVARLVDGRSNDEIAASLGIGRRAIEAHLTHLYGRFGLQSRGELAVRAVREGWLEAPVSHERTEAGEHTGRRGRAGADKRP